MQSYQNKSVWLEAAQEAVTYADMTQAHKVMSSWLELAEQPITTPQSDQSLEWLRQNLLLIAFPVLSADLATHVLQTLTRQFFEPNDNQLPASQQITDRFTFTDYGFYEEERTRLLEALKSSALTIGKELLQDWLNRFDSFQPANEERKVLEFLLQFTDERKIPKAEKLVLETVLYVYEEYLQYPVFNIYDYAALTAATAQGGQPVSRQLAEKLVMLKALSQYPNLGNQTISEERIKIKSQPAPVRGSLFNWIKYYRDELGIGQHSTVERGQFLFRSENGLKLTAQERENLNLVLKSIEENYPLDIDPERQVVIFPAATAKPQNTQPSPAPSMMRPPMPVAPKPAPVPFVPKPAPVPQPMATQSMAEKFQPAPVTPAYEKVAVPRPPMPTPDQGAGVSGVDRAAEALKREPKPEWIKGVFTKDNIPETLPVAPVAGAMSFSFNHTLPAEKENQTQSLSTPKSASETPPSQQPVSPAAKKPSGQFHIRPVSRPDL